MVLSSITTLGLLLQTTALATAHTPRASHPAFTPPPRAAVPDPIRVWRADSTLNVVLRDPGYVLLLHVNGDGRISVLFPWEPDVNAWTGGDTPMPMAIALPAVAQGNPATFVAVESRWPFNFTALRAGSPTWNYQDAWLLQPTAGDPLAALLDIADRITEGRPYEYGVIAYARGGAVATRREPLQPDVCLSCVRRRPAPPAPALAAATQTNTVDCSNSSMTNSFCGVANSSVTITGASAPAPQPVAYQAPPAAPATVPMYVPYYVPSVVGRHPFERPRRFPAPPPAPPPNVGAAFPMAPQPVVPSSTFLRGLGRRPR